MSINRVRLKVDGVEANVRQLNITVENDVTRVQVTAVLPKGYQFGAAPEKRHLRMKKKINLVPKKTVTVSPNGGV